MEGISHLIGAVCHVHQFCEPHALHRSCQCFQLLAVGGLVGKHLRQFLLQSGYHGEFHLHLHQTELRASIEGGVVGLQEVQIVYPREQRLQLVLGDDLRLLATEIIKSVATAQQEVYLGEVVFVLLLVFFYVAIDSASLSINAVARYELSSTEALENFTGIFHRGYITGYSMLPMVLVSEV